MKESNIQTFGTFAGSFVDKADFFAFCFCQSIGYAIFYSKGYYDRYLPRCTRAVKLGIAFEAQRVPHAALDEHDQRLDAFITEGGIYRGTDKIEL